MKKPLPGRITQRDIAKAAGVSQALVSQVLSGSGSADVHSEYRQRVLEAAEQLGYRKRGKATVDGHKRILAYIHPVVKRGHHQEEWLYRSYEDFYGNKRMLLEKAAQEAGFVLMSHAVTENGETLTRWLSEWDVEGVILHCNYLALAQWIRQRLPVVQYDCGVLDGVDAVVTNTVEMVEMAMKHLVANGHERIGFVSRFPLELRNSRLRRHAYLDFVERNGLPVHDYSETFRGEGFDWLEPFAQHFVNAGAEMPTALLLPDHYALRLQKCLLQKGLSLPSDLSMIGIDNISAGVLATPSLTSVGASSADAALDVIALMEARLREPNRVTRTIEVSPHLVERESVLPLSRSRESRKVPNGK